MPFEAAPFGVTGLETAFAALYTHLVEPGLIPLETLLERMSAGPARAFGLTEPRIAVGAPANLVLLDLEASWRCARTASARARRTRGCSGEKLRRASPADGRRRPAGSRIERDGEQRPTVTWSLEDGTVFRGESVRRTGIAFGEAVFTTAMTGYQEVVTDPSYAEQIVCFTAPMVGNYGVADVPLRVGRRPHASAVADARGARAGVDGLAARARHPRARPASTRARSCCTCAKAARCAPPSSPARSDVDEALAQVRAQPSMTGAALVGRRLDREPYVHNETGRSASRSSTTARKRSILRRLAGRRRAVTVFPHDVDADTLAGYDGVLLSNGPGDPEPLDGEVRTCASCSAGCRCSASASATSCSRSPPASRRSSCRSATAARTTRCSSGRPAACSSRARTTASRSRRRDAREATHDSLYDGTVEGFDYPELRARSVQFHPEAGPGPARRVADPRALGRGGAAAAARRPPLDLPDRLGADRDRPGLRVRLRRLPGAEGAARGRLPHDRRQLEPGDDHDRPRLRRPHLPRAARPRRRRGRARPRAARRAAADDGRPDGAQPRARAGRGGRARGARRRADRRRAST